MTSTDTSKALRSALEEAQIIVAGVDANVGDLTEPEDLWGLLEMVRELRGKEFLATLEDTLVRQLHGAMEGYRYTLSDGRRIVKGTYKASERWDGTRLISSVASRLADELWVDKETGEIDLPPPAVQCEQVATYVAQCLGGLAPSTKWRLGPLRYLGIRPDDYRTWEPGRMRVDLERG